MFVGTTIVIAGLAFYYLRRRRARKNPHQAPSPSPAA